MKIIYTPLQQAERISIQEFANRHDLVMEIRERPFPDLSRLYALFQGAEVKEGVFLVGKTGNGSSPEKAMADYADKISGTTIMLNALKGSRREIKVPRLYFDTDY